MRSNRLSILLNLRLRNHSGAAKITMLSKVAQRALEAEAQFDSIKIAPFGYGGVYVD